MACVLAVACGRAPQAAARTPCPDDANDAVASVRNACVARINAYRQSLSLMPLVRWCEAESCTDSEVRDDGAAATAHGHFGRCGERAQNECPGWPLPYDGVLACLEGMWAEGPGDDFAQHGHYINMSNPNVTRVACGFASTGQGQYWAAQNFR